MKKIPSFTVNHDDLLRGIYVSRQDVIGQEIVTTFDIRTKLPNREPVMNTAEIHTIEHLAATFLRNHETAADQTIYFGPMGCMTGFYLITKELDLARVIKIVRELFEQIANWQEPIPGAKMEECGNYSFMDLEKAKAAAKHFVTSEWQHEYHYL